MHVLAVDQTPATFWIVNPDNYVERNIAAGSTHYGIWFFPEPKVRGASEFEPGAPHICPQGVPLYHFADNEGHNNGKYGLRIFSGISPHNGEGQSGFYPKEADSCAPVSSTNLFKTARFERQFSWRNGHNGITFGSVAALHIVDAVVVPLGQQFDRAGGFFVHFHDSMDNRNIAVLNLEDDDLAHLRTDQPVIG